MMSFLELPTSIFTHKRVHTNTFFLSLTHGSFSFISLFTLVSFAMHCALSRFLYDWHFIFIVDRLKSDIQRRDAHASAATAATTTKQCVYDCCSAFVHAIVIYSFETWPWINDEYSHANRALLASVTTICKLYIRLSITYSIHSERNVILKPQNIEECVE